MKKFLFIMTFAAILISCNNANNSEIRIACNWPMTGNVGYYGKWWNHGMEIALSDISTEADSLGIKFSFDVQDNKGETKDAITIYKKQILSKPDIYMSGITTQTMAIIDQIHKTKLPHFVWSWTPIKLDSTQNDFRCWLNYGLEAKHIIDYCISKEPKKVAYLHLNISGAKIQCDDIIVPALKQQNPLINIFVEEFPVETTNFRDIIMKLKDFDADVIFVSGFVGHLLNILKDMQTYNIDKSKVLCSMDLLDAINETSDDLLENLHVTTPAFNINELKSEKTRRWIEAFIYNNEKKPTYAEAYGYDAIMMLFEAAKISKKEGTSIVDAIRKVDIEGITGELKFDSNGELKDNLHIAVFHNGILVID